MTSPRFHCPVPLAAGTSIELPENAARHAGVDEADLVITRTDGVLEVEVTDRGRGFDGSVVPGRGLEVVKGTHHLHALGVGFLNERFHFERAAQLDVDQRRTVQQRLQQGHARCGVFCALPPFRRMAGG